MRHKCALYETVKRHFKKISIYKLLSSEFLHVVICCLIFPYDFNGPFSLFRSFLHELLKHFCLLEAESPPSSLWKKTGDGNK